MAPPKLSEIVADIPSLRGVFITAMPDCLLYEAWTRSEESWGTEDVASYFGDLVRANREGLKALKSWSAEMQITIESADLLLVLRELRSDFVVAFAFQREVPLGMVRLHTKRALDRLGALLPAVEAEARPRGARIVAFLQKYAPDPHAVLQRVALQTGITVDTLHRPEALDQGQVALLESAVKDVLGLQTLSI